MSKKVRRGMVRRRGGRRVLVVVAVVRGLTAGASLFVGGALAARVTTLGTPVEVYW